MRLGWWTIAWASAWCVGVIILWLCIWECSWYSLCTATCCVGGLSNYYMCMCRIINPFSKQPTVDTAYMYMLSVLSIKLAVCAPATMFYWIMCVNIYICWSTTTQIPSLLPWVSGWVAVMAVQPGEEMIDILSEGEPDMSHMDYDLEYSVRVGKTEYVRK